ncbi:MAG: type II secretion system protein N [Parahaliea sp.]
MSVRILLPGLLLVLLAGLLISAPARLLAFFLPQDQVLLQGLNGTIWHGRASRVQIMTAAGPAQLGMVYWHLKPLSLLTLSPTLTIRSEWGEQRLQTEFTLYLDKTVSLKDVDASFDAGVLSEILPLALEGRFNLTAKSLHLGRDQFLAADGRLVWSHAAWNAPQGRIVLGNYAMDVLQADRNEPLTGRILSLNGPVEAAGKVTIDGAAYEIDMTISGQHSLDPVLVQALSLMAQPVENGFHLALVGTF